MLYERKLHRMLWFGYRYRQQAIIRLQHAVTRVLLPIRLSQAVCPSVSCIRAPNSKTVRSLALGGITDRTGCQSPSRSFKVDNFHFIWKGVCHFLLVINSNFGRITVYLRYGQFSVKTHIFLTPTIQPRIWTCFPCTKSLKFCTPRFKTQGKLSCINFPLEPVA